MTKSATTSRSGRRASIVAAAQELAIGRGYAGFTLDDLADAVGCSRRTLFNHVSSKEEAILGALPRVTEEQVETLRSGGPTGDLVTDLVTTVVTSLDNGGSVEEWRRLQAVIERNPDVLARVHEYTEDLTTHLHSHLCARPGVDDRRACVAIGLVGGVVSQSLRELIEQPDPDGLAARMQHNLRLARELLAAGE